MLIFKAVNLNLNLNLIIFHMINHLCAQPTGRGQLRLQWDRLWRGHCQWRSVGHKWRGVGYTGRWGTDLAHAHDTKRCPVLSTKLLNAVSGRQCARSFLLLAGGGVAIGNEAASAPAACPHSGHVSRQI